ncbi:hypothetical protein AK812_SmicGene37438 [Symbiodinium microadriaticum]|uniref:Uncharacterized protein n=1 Tax=Symbiodinium microadriaticum TaxID=2951 RepID=A0A1Q9CG90_SYMMI|nr:hypothetical protein AK812_SmicGene37438 [Symbiodinium microadriaticum]
MAEIFSLPNVTDRIFSFIAERTCTLFFYFSRSPGYQSDERSELWPYIPEAEQDGLYHTYLQHVVRAIKSLIVEHMSEIGGIQVTIHNAYGADSTPERLEIRQHTRGLRRFMLVEELIQGPILYVPVMFAIPALPQMICAASACRWTLNSIIRQINQMALIDTMMLVRMAQQKEMIFDWIQRPLEAYVDVTTVTFQWICPGTFSDADGPIKSSGTVP